jgi:hypothetical protein
VVYLENIKKIINIKIMENNRGEIGSKKLNSLQRISTAILILCIIIFFILVEESSKIKGYGSLAFPTVLIVGFFFGGLSITGKVKEALKSLGLVLIVALIAIAVSYFFRK